MHEESAKVEKSFFGANPVGACFGMTIQCLEIYLIDFIQITFVHES